MKKFLVLIVVMTLAPLALFAQLGLGGAAYFKAPVLLGQPINVDNLNVDQFSFGGDLRLKMGWLQLESLLLFSAGNVNGLDIYLDAGAALDLAILRLSIGAGPNFTWNFGTKPPLQAGLNAKVGADLMLGKVSVGLSYIMAMRYNNVVNINTGSGMLGCQVMFWLE